MSKIFIIPKSPENENEPYALNCVCLKHPRDWSKCMFYIDAKHKRAYELHSKQNEFYSWFIGNKLINDGNIYITTPIDPLFLLIPFIFNNSSKYQQLYDIFTENNINLTQSVLLQNLYPLNVLNCVANTKEFEDDIFIQFDKEKTLKWLSLKFENIKKSLIKNRIGKNLSGFQITDYVSGDTKLSEDEYKIQAFEILSDYICNDLAQQLKTTLCIPDLSNLFAPRNDLASNNKRKIDKTEAEDNDLNGSKDLKQYDPIVNSTTNKPENKKVKMTRAQRILSKVDKTGIPNIASFFNKK